MRFVHRLCLAVALASVGVATSSFAGVAFTGTVSPGDPSQVTPDSVVTIGPRNSEEASLDPRGSAVVDGGSQWRAAQVLVGAYDLALARMTVSGPGTKASVERAGSVTSPTLGVGQRGSGQLLVDNGAWLAVGSNQQGYGTLTLGPNPSPFPSGPAVVDVVGESTLLTIGSQLSLNGANTAKMRVSDGAVVRVGTPTTSNEMTVAVLGEIDIDGEWSELQTGGLTIGAFSPLPVAGLNGLVRIGAGATVRPYGQSLSGSASIARFGALEMAGGTFALPLRQVEGIVRGGGVLTRDVNLLEDGSLEVGADQFMRLDGQLTSRGEVAVEGGRLDVYGAFTNDDVGEQRGVVQIIDGEANFLGRTTNEASMRIVGSEVTFNQLKTSDVFLQTGSFYAQDSQILINRTITNQGVVELVNSTLSIDEGQFRNELDGRAPARLVLDNSQILGASPYFNTTIVGNGVLEARGGSSVVQPRVGSGGQGSLLVEDGAAIAFRSDAEFYGGVSVGGGALIEAVNALRIGNVFSVEVNGTNLEQPAVASNSLVQLNGELLIETSDATTFSEGQVFSLVTAAHITGAFSNLALPDLPGTLEFLPQLTDTELSLLVIDSATAIPGDYNADGCVNAADYTVLRDNDVQSTNPMAMVTWRTNYGRWLPGSGTPIPEPAAVAVVAISLAMVCGGRRTAPLGRS